MNGIEAAVDVDNADFRVKVSLERYFSDERARCYMSCSRGRPVRALARRLRRAFGLPRPFALLSRGHLLPPAEPLALLQHDDPVEVIPTKFPVVETRTRDRSPPSVEPSPPRPESSRDASPPRSPAAAADDVDVPSRAAANLDDMKRRALELLEEYAAPPARRRRRVRRRRAPRAAPAAPVSPAPPAPPPAAAVVRADASPPRPARLVRALPPADADAPLAADDDLTVPRDSPLQ